MSPRLLPCVLLLVATACGKKAEPVVLPEPSTDAPAPVTQPRPSTPPATDADAAARAAEALRVRLLEELAAPIHFDYDQDLIKDEDRANLDRKAAILQANPALRIRIAGHADDRGSDEYNLVLGTKRALAAKRYLEGRGIAASRIDVTSFGEERPVDMSGTEAGWARNRRDEFELVSGGDRLVAPR